MTAVVYGQTKIVQLLANSSAIDFSLQNNRGKTALDLALEKFDKTSARILEIKY